jgi:hypothetical protein
MSTARRVDSLEHNLTYILGQLSKENAGTQEAVKMLAAGLDEVAHRVARLETALKNAAEAAANG